MTDYLEEDEQALREVENGKVIDVEIVGLRRYAGRGPILRLTVGHRGTDDATIRLTVPMDEIAIERWPWEE